MPDWICRAPAMMLSSVDLPTPSGPISPTMQPAGSVERDLVERDDLAITLGDAVEARDRVAAPAHGGGLALQTAGGQATAGSVRT